MSKLECALELAARGWAVFPLVPRGKVPLTKDGFKSATTDPTQIRTWWREHAEANIGLATGSASGLVVLDIDPRHGGDVSFLVIKDEMPSTFSVVTGGGGAHHYFLHPGGKVGNRAGLMPGIDIRGDGGYVVAPGSTTEGKYYVLTDAPLAPLPPLLMPTRAASPGPVTGAAEVADGVRGDLAKSTLAFIATGAAPGCWHQAFYKAAIDLKQNQYTFLEAKELLEKATGYLDDTHDMPQLVDVYERRTPRHAPRLAEGTSEPITDSGASNEVLAPVSEAASLVHRASSFTHMMFKSLADPSKMKGLSTGIPGLDALLGGGKRVGELTVTLAVAKTGKSSLYAYLIHHLLAQGVPVGYASREMRPDSEVIPNLLSIEHRENILQLAIDGDLTDGHKRKYINSIDKWPLYFAPGYGAFPMDRIAPWVASLKQLGVHYFFIDHLHYCLREAENWAEAVELAQQLKSLAIEAEVHIDLIVQPTKIPDGVKLGLNGLRGGAGIGQALDNLLLLEQAPGERHVRKLTLDRARWPLAEPGNIYLQYDRVSRGFTEVAFQPDEPADNTRGGFTGKDFLLDS